MPKSVNPLEPEIRAMTVELIEGFRKKGRCDFIREFSEVLPLRVFMQLVDLPLKDLPRLKYLADQFTRPDGSIELPEVTRLLQEYLAPVINARRGPVPREAGLRSGVPLGELIPRRGVDFSRPVHPYPRRDLGSLNHLMELPFPGRASGKDA
jgi:hypothetical protein